MTRDQAICGVTGRFGIALIESASRGIGRTAKSVDRALTDRHHGSCSRGALTSS
jgi:hypothetical protein